MSTAVAIAAPDVARTSRRLDIRCYNIEA